MLSRDARIGRSGISLLDVEKLKRDLIDMIRFVDGQGRRLVLKPRDVATYKKTSCPEFVRQ